jgi:hypothetical protein
MFTSEELGVERLEIDDAVYRFDWSKPLTEQLCLGVITEIISTNELREGYKVESIYDISKFDETKVYTRLDLEKAPKDPDKTIKRHIKDLESYALRNLGRTE